MKILPRKTTNNLRLLFCCQQQLKGSVHLCPKCKNYTSTYIPRWVREPNQERQIVGMKIDDCQIAERKSY